MADSFNPYREALVVEHSTIWSEELGTFPEGRRPDIERQLHAHPEQAAQLAYVRLHTGFCRQITVTAADLARLEPQSAP